MFVKTQLKNIASYSKGVQINGDKLIDDGIYEYLNGGIVPSGKWNDFNTPGKTITISEGGNSCGYVNYMQKPFWCGAHCYYLFDTKINSEYLYYALKSQQDRLMGIRSGACMPNIKKTDLGMFEIKYDTDENKQEIVVKALRNVEFIINSRLKELHQLDQLIKARFVEMFGDPASNNKGWLVAKLGEYITLLTDFSANGSYELLDSNVVMYDEPNYALMVRTTDLENRDFSNNVKYIDENAYELLSKSKLYGGELIMNKIGSAGRIYLMPYLGKPASLGRNAFMFRFDERINVNFLYMLLTTEYGTNEIQQYVRGAVTKTITKDSARLIRIIVPPISLQNEFENFVQQIDKSKVVVQKALDEAQTLFDSLMQEYFG
mgnify:CR=1 FL=1